MKLYLILSILFPNYYSRKKQESKKQISELIKQEQGHLEVIQEANYNIRTLRLSRERDWCLFNQWVEVKIRERSYISEIRKNIKQFEKWGKIVV